MKNIIKHSVLQTIFCLLICANSFAQIAIALTPPADTAGVCEPNIYSINISGANGRRIVIDASIDFNLASASCSSPSDVYLSFISGGNVSQVVTYNNGKKMSFNVTGATATLSYSAYINLRAFLIILTKI